MNPPLPNPLRERTPNGGGFFTAAQLLAYRAEVIEMCAKVCDVQIASGALGAIEVYRAGFIAETLRGLK